MSYQQAYTYWQQQRSSMASEASYQRLFDNHPNPNANLAPSQQSYQTYSGTHHVNLTGVHQSLDTYDSLFPTDCSANSAVMRNTAEGKYNQTDYQGPAWTSTSTHQITRLPMGVTTSEALRSQGVASIHEGSLPLISQIRTQQPAHYTHHLQLESTSQSACHQQMHQTVWAQQSQQLSHPQLPSLHPSNQQLLPRKDEGLISASSDSTRADEPDQKDVSELTAPDAQYHSTSSTITQPVSREPLVKKMPNEMRYEEMATSDVIPNDGRNSDTSYKTQENGSCYCKLCDVVCSGPLNLKMHLKGPKHKLNMQTKDSSCKLGAVDACKNRYKSRGLRPRGFVPLCHNQNDRPIIGLDFVTRVVTPDAKDDTYECSLCDKSYIPRRCVYLHVMAKSHRQAYIKKLKPDLAEQYCTVEDVYKQNEKLQKRESVDLAVLLNSIIKIAAKRDGPGQTHIRLSSERDCDVLEEQEDTMMDELEIHCGLVDRHHDSQVDVDEASFMCDPTQSPHRQAKDDTAHCVSLQSNPCHPSAQLTNQSKTSIQPSKESTEPTGLPSQAFSFEEVTPYHQTSSSDVHSISTLQQPSMDINQTQQDASISHGAQSTSMRHSNVSHTMPSTAYSQMSSMPLPMTDDQLRPYCSDVFISQEHQRRFGDSLIPVNNDHRTSESNSSISKVFAEGSRSVDILLKSLSDPEVNSEEDAALAIELTRALTQATFKYRLKQKNFVGLESQGSK